MKVINFYGGAAIGKSTIAADMYSKLKRMGYRTELVGEFAKWLWYQNATDIVEERGGALHAYECKWARAGGRLPESFQKAYPGASYEIVNRDNVWDYIGA